MLLSQVLFISLYFTSNVSAIGKRKNWIQIPCVIVKCFYFQENLFISHNADKTMKSFCQWQSDEYIRGGTNHDVALLLTRFAKTYVLCMLWFFHFNQYVLFNRPS
jgi:hypothetical protein